MTPTDLDTLSRAAVALAMAGDRANAAALRDIIARHGRPPLPEGWRQGIAGYIHGPAGEQAWIDHRGGLQAINAAGHDIDPATRVKLFGRAT